MNQKYLFPLLIFFLFIHVKNTYGSRVGCNSGKCRPAGEYCGKDRPCGAQVTDANLLADSTLNITISSPSPLTGLGHFTIRTDQRSHKFFKNPRYYNGGDCHVTDGKVNPFNIITFKYDFPTPPLGTWFDIWVSVYWHCHGAPNRMTCSVKCTSEDIHYRGYVR